MSKSLSVELIPLGFDDVSLDYDLGKSATCAATFYREAIDWEKSALEIKWNATERVFSVQFNGTGQIEVTLDKMLSKRIPLQIAKSSRCECGSVLELGDYTVSIEDSDFRFHADYFCPACKAHLTAEKRGLKKLLETWFIGLKKIEIKATGVGFERA